MTSPYGGIGDLISWRGAPQFRKVRGAKSRRVGSLMRLEVRAAVA